MVIAALLFQIHRIQDLRLHLPLFHGLRQFQDPVCQGGLAMIDVRDDRKIANMTLIHVSSSSQTNRVIIANLLSVAKQNHKLIRRTEVKK